MTEKRKGSPRARSVYGSERTNRTKTIVMTALFAALVAVGAFIQIPTLSVPITLQFAFCLMTAHVMGTKGGNSVAIYVAMGLVGLPVFTGGGGIMYVLKPSFGYLIGMIAGTYLCGFISSLRRKSYWLRLIGSLSALFIVDLTGALYMYLIYNFYLGTSMGVAELMMSAVVVFLPTDVTWCVLMSLAGYKLEGTRFSLNR